MGYILLVVLVVTVYGTDLVLQRFLHSTDEEVALQRAVDALCADLSTLRAWQAAVDTEVALLCAAADASEAEFANLRQHQTKVDPEVKAAANGSANNVDNAREVGQGWKCSGGGRLRRQMLTVDVWQGAR